MNFRSFFFYFSLFYFTSSPSFSETYNFTAGNVFTINDGQWDEKIKFRTEQNGSQLRFLQNGISYAHLKSYNMYSNRDSTECLVWNVTFLNASKSSIITSYNKLAPTPTTYFKDATAKPITPANYEFVEYKNVYNNIDTRYYYNKESLEYDFIIHPNGNVNDIRLQCEGIEKLSVNKNGQIEITNQWGVVTENTPYAYQVVNNKRKKIEVNFVLLNNNQYGFSLGKYNPDYDVIIDPVIMLWSTFVGGASGYGHGLDLAVDAQKNVYITGAYTTNFPTTPGVYAMTNAGLEDAYVAKLNSTGTTLLWATYIGGRRNDRASGIAVNSSGEVFISGRTQSANYPCTGSYKTTFEGDTLYENNIFLTKINNTGTSLLYSTYIGNGTFNSFSDGGMLAINNTDEAYIVGSTGSTTFPITSGVVQPAKNLLVDAFIFKMNSTGSGPVFSTFLGGNKSDYGCSIQLNSSNGVIITGHTTAADFPTTPGAYDITQNGFAGSTDNAFISLLNASGTALIGSTYLGAESFGIAVDVDLSDNIYVTGYTTQSTGFPTTAGAFLTSYPGSGNVPFVSKFNSTLTTLSYSTFINCTNGWASSAFPTDIDVDDAGCVYTVGYYNWNSLPDKFPKTSCAYYTSYPSTIYYMNRNYFLRLNNAGSNLEYAGNISGQGSNAHGLPKIKLYDSACDQKLAMLTTSPDNTYLTTPGTIQPTKLNATFWQPVLTIWGQNINPGFTAQPQPDITSCYKVKFTDTTSATTGSYCGLWTLNGTHTYQWYFGDGDSSALSSPTHAYTGPGIYTATMTVMCPLATVVKSVTVSAGNVTANAGSDVSINSGNSTILNASGGATYSWSPSTGLSCTNCASPDASPTETTMYYLTSYDANGCSASDSILITVEQPCGVKLPNAFSPNNDGQNDVLVVNSNCVENTLFQIFDRWGELVYQTTDLTKYWDGMYRNQNASTAVYTYVLSYQHTSDGTQLVLNGTINLLR